jgi:Zn-dependent metalloprotease
MVKHDPIFCIIPPHMLEHIASHGFTEQRELAQRTFNESENIRARRNQARQQLPVRSAAATSGKQRTIYDARHAAQLPGTKVRGEGDPLSSDPAVNEAFDGSGLTYDLYSKAFGRNSVDDHGLPLDSSVHYQKGYDNAFWDGQQMVYGDGDEDLPPAQRLFNRFTIALDVIGHELTHGVTQYEANLDYSSQAGALNESISDVFGSLVKQYQRKQTADQADWIIGEGLFTANVNGIGLRSLKSPGSAYNDPVLGRDPQPMHMDHYLQTTSDNGGVHINSGIPNHAFYLVARALGGFAWEKAGLIWYTSLTEKLKSNSNFTDAANLTHESAGQLFGKDSTEQKAVQSAWAAVGLTIGVASSSNGCLPAALRALGGLSGSASGKK